MKISSLLPGIIIGFLFAFFVFILLKEKPLSKDEQHFAYLIDIYKRNAREILPAVDTALMIADLLVRKTFEELPALNPNEIEISKNVSNAAYAIENFKEWDLQLSVLEYQIKDLEAFDCENYFLKKKKESFLERFYQKKKELDQKKENFLDFLDKKMNENIAEKAVFRI